MCVCVVFWKWLSGLDERVWSLGPLWCPQLQNGQTRAIYSVCVYIYIYIY